MEIEFYLGQYNKKNEVKNGIDNMWYQGSNTKTGDALMVMVNKVFNTHHGMRDDRSIPKVSLFIFIVLHFKKFWSEVLFKFFAEGKNLYPYDRSSE